MYAVGSVGWLVVDQRHAGKETHNLTSGGGEALAQSILAGGVLGG